MKVGLLGTGLLGLPIAERMLEAGHDLTVYNRTIEKALPLKKKGATVTPSAAEVISSSACVILMLSDGKAIEEVVFNSANPSLAGKTFIQMGTIASLESIRLQKKIFELGGEYLECPVLGSRKEAVDAQLILMVGASADRFQKWNDFLTMFGSQIYHIGDVGKASALKLALNHLIAAHAVAFSLSLSLVQHHEIDVGQFMGILRGSALYAPMFDKKLPKWLNREYVDANFPVKHMLKDVNLIIDEAKNNNLQVEAVEAIKRLLDKAMSAGLGEMDYSAVFNIIDKAEP